MATAIKTKKRVPIEWDDKNRVTVYDYGDKDHFGSTIWFDDNGNAYGMIYARRAGKYSLNPMPAWNKAKEA